MQNDNKAAPQYNSGFEYGVKHILSPRSGLLSCILMQELHLSEASLKELLQLGSIYLEGRRLLNDKEIFEGDYLRIHTKPRRFPANDFDWAQRMIFEDENFVVVHKPAGLPVHPSVDNCLENLQIYLSNYLQQEIFITHRLDVPTSGLIVLAKNKNFLSLFNHLLAHGKVEKIYRARVQGQNLKEGLYTHYMEPSPRAPKTVSLTPQEHWQECRLRLIDIQNDPRADEQEVRVELLTGRTHQIRAQLSALGAPICGDVLYGALKKYDLEKIDLEAENLRFLEFEFAIKRR